MAPVTVIHLSVCNFAPVAVCSVLEAHAADRRDATCPERTFLLRLLERHARAGAPYIGSSLARMRSAILQCRRHAQRLGWRREKMLLGRLLR